MADREIKAKLVARNDTAENWRRQNPVLLRGELGVEIDTGKIKYGDGVKAWNDLSYSFPIAEDISLSHIDGMAATTVQEAVAENFQSVVDGKKLLETAVIDKGGTVEKAGSVATFSELRTGIAAISSSAGGYTEQSLPPQIKSLALECADQLLTVRFTGVDAQYLEFADEYWVVHKTGSMPALPSDGCNKIIPAVSGAVEVRLTEGVQNDVENYIRVYVSGKNGLQTSPDASGVIIPSSNFAASALKLGDKIILGNWHDTPQKWIVCRLETDGNITLISEFVQEVLAFDSSEASPHLQGYARYDHSNIFQWANSTAPAGQWYSKKHSADSSPSSTSLNDSSTGKTNPLRPYYSWPGYLNGWQTKDIEALVSTARETSYYYNNANQQVLRIPGKIHLPSSAEMGSKYGAETDEPFELFEAGGSRIKFPTQECVSNTTFLSSAESAYVPKDGVALSYWTRSMSKSSYDTVARSVNGRGSASTNYAYDSIGFVPICTLSAETLMRTCPTNPEYYEVSVAT